jgi:hypothetical protein
LNHAKHLETILLQLLKVETKPAKQMRAAWCVVFEVDDADSSAENDVVACLLALRNEIEVTIARLRAREIPPNLWEGSFRRLYQAASATELHANWAERRGNLAAPEVRMAFGWASFALAVEGDSDIPEADLQRLHAELEELEEAIRSAEMSEFMRSLVQRQVAAIRSALRLHKIQGVAPLQDAVSEIIGKLTINAEEIGTEVSSASPVAKTLFRRVLNFVVEVGKAAKAVRDTGSLIGDSTNLVSRLIAYCNDRFDGS